MIEVLLVGLFSSLIITFIIMPKIISIMKKKGMTGIDKNKINKPIIAEMGGLGVVIGCFSGIYIILILMKFWTHESLESSKIFLSSLFTMLGAALIGVLDDIFNLRQKVKAILPAFFAFPLSYYMIDETITLPIVGSIHFGLLMIIIIPFMITSAANSMNMLDGFNGLGAGLGIIMGVTLISLFLITGNLQGGIFIFPLIGSLAAFLYFNFYPAKIFPGDTLTLFVGTSLAIGAINGLVKEIALLLFLPMIIEFFMKSRGLFQARNQGIPQKNGLIFYYNRSESLTHIVMKNVKVTEKKIVGIFWGIEVLLCISVISLTVVKIL